VGRVCELLYAFTYFTLHTLVTAAYTWVIIAVFLSQLRQHVTHASGDPVRPPDVQLTTGPPAQDAGSHDVPLAAESL